MHRVSGIGVHRVVHAVVVIVVVPGIAQSIDIVVRTIAPGPVVSTAAVVAAISVTVATALMRKWPSVACVIGTIAVVVGVAASTQAIRIQIGAVVARRDMTTGAVVAAVFVGVRA